MGKQPASPQKNLIDPNTTGPYRDVGKPPEPGKPTEAASLARIEDLAKKYAISAMETKGRFERAMILAEGMEQLRQAVRPILPRLTQLMNSPLGFLTDRKEKSNAYPEEVVLDALIESTLRGLYPVGNEFNIIAGRCYVTKDGYARLVRELPDFFDLKLEPGVPKVMPNGAVVPYRASWKFQGKGFVLERQIPVRLNAGMGADGAIGKATRKMLASIHARCTGSFLTEADAEGDDLPALPAPPTKPVRENGHPVVATQEQRGQMSELASRLKLTEEEFRELCEQFGAPGGDGNQMTQRQAEEMLMHMEDLVASEPAEA